MREEKLDELLNSALVWDDPSGFLADMTRRVWGKQRLVCLEEVDAATFQQVRELAASIGADLHPAMVRLYDEHGPRVGMHSKWLFAARLPYDLVDDDDQIDDSREGWARFCHVLLNTHPLNTSPILPLGADLTKRPADRDRLFPENTEQPLLLQKEHNDE